ncbi:MAG TPA: hypothetical protein ENJ06_03815, partial [Phycisphaeraceae bacterium]|nr:hypothetical protein [Phycisphaeraceae bacterium]
FPTNDNSDNISSFALEQVLYQAGITLSLPLDREIERAGLRQATIRLMQAERDLQRRQDEIIVDARRAVRDMDRARLSIQLQERNIYITQRRQELLNLREDSDLQLKLDAETDLLRARDARDAAIRDLRIAVLDYLLTTGQMRVTADGMFQPLGGMKLIPDETPENHTQPNNTTNESLENADPGPEENSQVIPGDLEETESGPTVQTEGVNVNENQS